MFQIKYWSNMILIVITLFIFDYFNWFKYEQIVINIVYLEYYQ